jgi:hypothetical protein
MGGAANISRVDEISADAGLNATRVGFFPGTCGLSREIAQRGAYE